MIKQIRNRDLKSTAVEINALGGVRLNGRLSMKVVGVGERIADLRNTLEKSRVQLLKGYAKLDAQKELIKTKEGKAVFKSAKDEEKYYTAYNELLEEVVEVEYPPVIGVTDDYLESLEEITPAQLIVLKKFKEK